jgi:hypothetical protein
MTFEDLCQKHDETINNHEKRLCRTEGKLEILLKIDAISNIALVVSIIIFVIQSFR